jgi:hypothetical protein
MINMANLLVERNKTEIPKHGTTRPMRLRMFLEYNDYIHLTCSDQHTTWQLSRW